MVRLHTIMTNKLDPIVPLWAALLIGFGVATVVVALVDWVSVGGAQDSTLGGLHIVMWVAISLLLQYRARPANRQVTVPRQPKADPLDIPSLSSLEEVPTTKTPPIRPYQQSDPKEGFRWSELG